MAERDHRDLTDAEREALDECQLAIECLYGSYSDLLGFHTI